MRDICSGVVPFAVTASSGLVLRGDTSFLLVLLGHIIEHLVYHCLISYLSAIPLANPSSSSKLVFVEWLNERCLQNDAVLYLGEVCKAFF